MIQVIGALSFDCYHLLREPVRRILAREGWNAYNDRRTGTALGNSSTETEAD